MKEHELEVGRQYSGLRSGVVKTLLFVGRSIVVVRFESGEEETFGKDLFLKTNKAWDIHGELVGKSFKNAFGRIATVQSVVDGDVAYSVRGVTVVPVAAFMENYREEVK